MPTITDLPVRFQSKIAVQPDTGCWQWTAGKNDVGYAYYAVGTRAGGDKRMTLAHRFAYTELVGVIPEGLTLDHLCRNTACVNPAHLEPVTPRVNVLRGLTIAAANGAKTHCAKGHEYSPENTHRTPDGSRVCLACHRERKRSKRRHLPNSEKTHCPQGHEYSAENTLRAPNGNRKCRECNRQRMAKYNERRH